MNAEDPRPATDARLETRNGPTTLGDRVQSLRLPPRADAGPGKLPWVLCAVLLASTLTFGFQAFRKGSDSDAAARSSSPGADGKKADSGDVVLQAKGYIIPAHQIQVSPQVGGKIEKLYITEGQRVKKGEVLAEIEEVDYKTDYDRALFKHTSAQENYDLLKANLPNEIKKAEHDLAESRADFIQVQDSFKRAERLPRSTQSDEELMRVRGQYNMADARHKRKREELILAQFGFRRVAVARAEASAARADLEKAKWKLDNCKVRAPVSGIILTKKAEEGNLVNPVAFNVSANLCDMADLSDLEVDLTIQERDIAHVFVGQNCTVMPEAFQSNEKFLRRHPGGYVGKVTRLMPIADRAKGAIPVRVGLKVPRDEEGVYLKPDMGVIVSFKKQGK